MNVFLITLTATFSETILIGFSLMLGETVVWGTPIAAWTITEDYVGVPVAFGPARFIAADRLVLSIGSADFQHLIGVYVSPPPSAPALSFLTPIQPDAPQEFTYSIEVKYIIEGMSYE